MSKHHAHKAEQRLKEIQAKDLMSKFAITILGDDTIHTAAHLMMRFQISGVPVCAKNGDICGMVTATDLFNFMKEMVPQMENDEDVVDPSAVQVKDLMTRDVITISEETSLYEMIQMMVERNVHTLPVMVVSKKEIIGVIGRRDILNAFYIGSGSGLKQ